MKYSPVLASALVLSLAFATAKTAEAQSRTVNETQTMTTISTYNDLAIALQSDRKDIVISRNITSNHTLILPEGVSLRGVPQENGELPMLLFANCDGIGLTRNNTIKDLKVNTPTTSRAIFTTYSKEDLGTFHLENLSVQGQVALLFRIGTSRATVRIKDLDIYAADARHFLEQPQKYGVNVLQGALTIYNLNGDDKSLIEVTAEGVKIGRKDAPVLGSGIFIAGAGDKGGRTEISRLETGSVYSTGKIPYGVADYITGGIFILNGAHAKEVIANGELVTYGVNDMVTDVWGSVDDWTNNGPITSYGPSGIGFVNFGKVKNYTTNAPLQTYGEGARGHNQYDGTVEHIKFRSIETFGDGSIGIQISKKIGTVTVEEGVKTYGAIGNSLVKGVITRLPAYAISIKEGGHADKLEVKGNITTNGDKVTAYITEKGGDVTELIVGGKIEAKGRDAKPKELEVATNK